MLLYTPAYGSTGVLRSSNSAVFGFGLLGSWRVTIAGSWTPAEEAFTGRAAAVGANNSGSLVHSAGVPSPVLVGTHGLVACPELQYCNLRCWCMLQHGHNQYMMGRHMLGAPLGQSSLEACHSVS
jgi:hypothetical protein